MSQSSNQLFTVLETMGKSPTIVNGPAGESIAVLPHGGRILGLFPAHSDLNFFWTNPQLSTESSAAHYFASADWHNSGGDRTWLAPELDFLFPDYPDTGRYFQPRQLDPGDYTISAVESGIELQNDLSILSSRSGNTIPLRITKRVCSTRNPLRHLRDDDLAKRLEFAGYSLHTSLDLLTGVPGADRVGLWNLLQMPSGGEMLVSTLFPISPTNFIGVPSANAIGVQNNLIRYVMNATGVQKISISALALTGRAGYVFEQGNKWSLVVRAFFVDPAGTYVDANPHDPLDDGYAFQACNVNTSDLGAFAELEYHAPAIGGDTGQLRSVDVSYVWAYRGDHLAIRQAARVLLGANW